MTKKIAIIDYGVGNIKSVVSALRHYGAETQLTADHCQIQAADAIVLPGVGSYLHGITNLKARGLDTVICQYALTGKPVMGICLGMQLLMEKSYEFGEHQGLGLIGGVVKQLPEQNLSLPHIGWEETKIGQEDTKDYFYCHSYIAVPSCEEDVLGTSKYGDFIFCAAVRRNNVMGFQFHPEKSGKDGLKLIEQFMKTV